MRIPRKTRDEDVVNPLARPERNKNRTRVPQAMPRSYEVAPASRVIQGHNAYARPIGAAGDDIIRRMKARKQAQNKGRKSGLIIG
jgi:transcription factor SPN1